MGPPTNKPRPVCTCDVSDAEWEFCLPYLLPMKEDAQQRQHPLRELFNALRYIVRCGCQWRMMPHDLPPRQVVYQQTQRWMKAGCFEVMAHARLAKGRKAQLTAAIMDGRTLQSSPESGGRAGHDGYKRRNGSKVHIAVETLGHLLAVKVTPANEQERAQVGWAGRADPGSHRRQCGAGLGGPGLHRKAARPGRAGPCHSSGRGEAFGGQEGVRSVNQTMGA